MPNLNEKITPSQRGRIFCGGALLEYNIYGHGGETVLLLHGNGEDHQIFASMLPRLSEKYRVIAPDSRGQGHSDLGDSTLDYERMADDAAFLLARLGADEPHVIGFSDGAISALLLALLYRGLVKSLTLIGCNLSPAGLKLPVRASIFGSYLRHTALSPFSPSHARKRILTRMMLTQPHISPKSLASLTLPSLVIAGERDAIRSGHTELIASSLPQAEKHIIPRAGHMLPTERPEELLKLILPFLAKNR